MQCGKAKSEAAEGFGTRKGVPESEQSRGPLLHFAELVCSLGLLRGTCVVLFHVALIFSAFLRISLGEG